MDIQPDLTVSVLPGAGATVDLIPCVESLLRQNDPVLLEIVAPKGCGLEEAFGTCPELHLVDFPYAEAGRNLYQLWKRATGRYLAVFDGSVVAGAGSLFAMLDFLDEHPDVGAAAPRLFSSGGDLVTNCFRFPRLPFGSPKKMKGWDGRAAVEVDWMATEVVFVNTIAFADCCTKEFPAEGWSLSLCKRLWAGGWHQYFVPSSKAIVPSSPYSG